MNTDKIRLELHQLAMTALFPDDPSMKDELPDPIDTIHEIDDTIFRLDMPEHGATGQVYGYYTEDGALQYALAGVRGETFTLIYPNPA